MSFVTLIDVGFSFGCGSLKICPSGIQKELFGVEIAEKQIPVPDARKSPKSDWLT